MSARRKGAISVAFVCLSVRPSVCLSVCLSVAYIANNSRTQRPSVPKFGRKVSHLRCDTRIPVTRSNGQRSGLETGDGHTMSAEPGCYSACIISKRRERAMLLWTRCRHISILLRVWRAGSLYTMIYATSLVKWRQANESSFNSRHVVECFFQRHVP